MKGLRDTFESEVGVLAGARRLAKKKPRLAGQTSQNERRENWRKSHCAAALSCRVSNPLSFLDSLALLVHDLAYQDHPLMTNLAWISALIGVI